MTTDFLDFLRKSRGRFAFVATYEFDPQFFERRILCAPAFEGALTIVFADNDRYHNILAAGRQGQGFDRNYFVIPMSRAGGVFHPKLYLAIGDKKVIASVGSNNCTSAGTGHNFELISTLESSSGIDRSIDAPVIASIYRQFRRYAQEAGPVSKWLKTEIFDEAEATYPWLAEIDEDEDGQEVELLSSHDDPLLPQVVKRLAGKEIGKITLLAPFFDKNLRIVERMMALWPGAAIQIVSQSGYSNLPIERFKALSSERGNIELISARSEKAGRNMHAKALTFEAADCTYWLVGSANMSNAALAGGNSEACLWFATKQTAAQALKHDALVFKRIDPDDFDAAAIEEPAPPVEEMHGLKLQSIVLTDGGQLLVSADVPAQTVGLTLRIFKRNEPFPTFSWEIDPAKTDITMSLKDDDQAKFDQPAVGQLDGVIDGFDAKSPLCSVKQLPQLLRDRAGGHAASNRLQRVMDSGEGLIEYVDALDGVDAVIDFMNQTNIRFNDDAHSGGRGGGRWRPRDPFSGDIPDHWAMGSSGGSVTELREAIWGFVQRHIDTRLERHARRGNLGGLPNFLDIYRTLSQVLLAWHNRHVGEEVVIPAPFVTDGLSKIIAAMIGARGENHADSPGFGEAILTNLSADADLVRSELDRHRVPAIISATADEMIRVRAIFLKRTTHDSWSQARLDWVAKWIEQMQLASPTKADIQEIGTEFKLAA